jgi:hypothetical protein
MKVLTAQQMREADRQTIAGGTPGDVLMARAGSKVVEFLESEFSPLSRQRVVIFCGDGNNGGDGLVVGRLLKTRVEPQVVRAADTPAPVVARPPSWWMPPRHRFPRPVQALRQLIATIVAIQRQWWRSTSFAMQVGRSPFAASKCCSTQQSLK